MRALICGISGQDGAYLANYLLSQGYEVFGTSRDAQVATFENLRALKIRDAVEAISMAITDFRSVVQGLSKCKPDEVYNLAGQSSVGLSFEQPVETMESISIGTLNLLEAIRFIGKPIRLYNAISSECFGDIGHGVATETTPFRPRSPYAVAKAAAFWEGTTYRKAYGLFVSNGILFNHESPLRPERFVTRKIVAAAVRVAQGSEEKLCLGELGIVRDWGWSAEYVVAMRKMLQLERPGDFVVATGVSHTLEEFVNAAFSELGLDWREHVIIDDALKRPSELSVSRADPGKAEQVLGWKAQFTMLDVVHKMIEAERARIKP